MIGDAIPHNTSYHLNDMKLDWKKEAGKLKSELGIKIYSVHHHSHSKITPFNIASHYAYYLYLQALNNSAGTSFYRELANLTDGYHLHLDQFSSIVQFILAICFREQSLDMLQVLTSQWN